MSYFQTWGLSRLTAMITAGLRVVQVVGPDHRTMSIQDYLGTDKMGLPTCGMGKLSDGRHAFGNARFRVRLDQRCRLASLCTSRNTRRRPCAAGPPIPTPFPLSYPGGAGCLPLVICPPAGVGVDLC